MLSFTYPTELETKETTDSAKSASYLDFFLEIVQEGKLVSNSNDKRDDFNFPIENFPYLCGNIPASPAHGVYVAQLIRYDSAFSKYKDIL